MHGTPYFLPYSLLCLPCSPFIRTKCKIELQQQHFFSSLTKTSGLHSSFWDLTKFFSAYLEMADIKLVMHLIQAGSILIMCLLVS